MKQSIFRVLALLAGCILVPLARTATIFQALNGTYIAWKAGDTFAITFLLPTRWFVTDDATASGTQTLYPGGVIRHQTIVSQ